MRQTLFRPEATEGLRPRLEGEVVALSPLSARAIVVACLVAVLSAGVFSATAQYSKFVTATGEVAPADGLVRVLASQDGQLAEVKVSDGANVHLGEVLAVLKTPSAMVDGQVTAAVQQRLAQARASLTDVEVRARLDVLAAQARNADAKAQRLIAAHRAASAALVSAQAGLQLARDNTRRQQELAAQGFVAQALVTTTRQQEAERELTVRQAEQAMAELQADIETAKASADEARTQRALVQATGQSSRAGYESDALTAASRLETVLTAPVEGQVVAAPPVRGPVSKGQPLVVVAPRGPLYAHLTLNEAAAAKARVGQQVVLRLRGQSITDAARYDGTIESISSGRIGLSDSPSGGRLALVKLNSTQGLAPGSLVDARLRVETHTLLGWLVQPLRLGLGEFETSNESRP